MDQMQVKTLCVYRSYIILWPISKISAVASEVIIIICIARLYMFEFEDG